MERHGDGTLYKFTQKSASSFKEPLCCLTHLHYTGPAKPSHSNTSFLSLQVHVFVIDVTLCIMYQHDSNRSLIGLDQSPDTVSETRRTMWRLSKHPAWHTIHKTTGSFWILFVILRKNGVYCMSMTEVYNYKIHSYDTEVRCYEMHCTIYIYTIYIYKTLMYAEFSFW